MNKEIISLLKNAQDKADKLKPFNPDESVKNAELKMQITNLIALAINKLES